METLPEEEWSATKDEWTQVWMKAYQRQEKTVKFGKMASKRSPFNSSLLFLDIFKFFLQSPSYYLCHITDQLT